MGLARFREMTRQKLHLTTEVGFQTTSNEKAQSMLKECTAYVDVVKNCEKAIMKQKRATSRLLAAAHKTVSGQSPRVHIVDPHTGKVAPIYERPVAVDAGAGDYTSRSATSSVADEPQGPPRIAGPEHHATDNPFGPVKGEEHVSYPDPPHNDMTALALQPKQMTRSAHSSAQNSPRSGSPTSYIDAHGPASPPSPLPPAPEPLAPAIRTSELDQIISQMELRMDNECLKPIAGWLNKFEHAKKSMQATEAVRLLYDASRRSAYHAELKTVKSKKGGDPDENLVRDMQVKDANCQASRQRWEETESILNAELTQLVTEAAYIEKYLALALHISAEAFRSSIVE